jgi:hypothetical protein
MLVLMALVTTLMTSPALSLIQALDRKRERRAVALSPQHL